MKIHFLFIFFSLFLWAETLNEQIHALEEATPKERVELMNHIKEQLISMHEADRMKTLGALKAKLHPKEEATSTKHDHMGNNQVHSHESESEDRMQSCMGKENVEHSSPMMNQGMMNSEMMHQEERMNQNWQQQRGERANQEWQDQRGDRENHEWQEQRRDIENESPHNERERNVPNRQSENQNNGGR